MYEYFLQIVFTENSLWTRVLIYEVEAEEDLGVVDGAHVGEADVEGGAEDGAELGLAFEVGGAGRGARSHFQLKFVC